MLYDASRLLIVAGPCALESESMAFEVARVLAELAAREARIQVVFKSSFDKANRAKSGGLRGIGQEAGLQLLAAVKTQFNLPLVTDVHAPEQCDKVAQVVDVLQIPAFLCRQTDLLEAAAQTGRVVQVKKGQFLSPYEMEFVVDKLRKAGAKEVWQVERGTTFGYQNLVLDYRNFPIMQEWGHPVLFDSHCVQRPGTIGGQSGGDRQFIPHLARAACAAGADGLFIETHPDPKKAISDAATQLNLSEFSALIESCLSIWSLLKDSEGIK
jgi:2-dehydro-3-deoxyphosphooctonate aldolase (KDO 8-P synthase)